MDREYDRSNDEALIELGPVTEETKGAGFVNLDVGQTLNIPAGLTDD